MKTNEAKSLAVKNPFAAMTPKERICRISRLNLAEFIEESKGKPIDKDSWLAGKIVASFEYLRERMTELKLSRDEMLRYGLDFSEFRKLYFSVA